MENEKLFDNIPRTEYIISEDGFKIPHSDFDRDPSYYDKLRNDPAYGDKYADMCVFKDKGTALFDKRWKSAKAVIDMVAQEVGIDPENSGLYLYGLTQNGSGDFESPLVDKIREWSAKSGDKVKLKKRISELESQVSALRSLLRE